MKTQRKRISSHLKNGRPTKPIRCKSVCEQKVMFAHFLKLIIQNRFRFALTITSAFEIHWVMFFMLRCLLLPSPSSLLALNFKSAFSLQGFLGVKSSPARIYSRRSCVCCSVPFAWEIAWDSPIVNIVSQTMNKQVSYNRLQKYLRHCTVFWHKWPIHDLVLVIPPPPLINVASNTKPYSKLGATTLNGREEGGQCYISETCDQERFEAGKVVFSWECLNIFATGCSSLWILWSLMGYRFQSHVA